jgi:hypothetical protein
MMQVIKDQQPKFFQVISHFLQSELLSDQFVKLEQAGHAAEHKTLLAQVFVDLPAAEQPIIEQPKNEQELEKVSLGIVAEILNANTQT